MALAFVLNLQNIWPFSVLKSDDLKVSNELVRKLRIPERTKQFVYAVQYLSEWSATDADCLIREIRPDAVIAQVGHSTLTEIQSEESVLCDGFDKSFPTSTLGVLKRCFLEKVNKERYEDIAGNLVLQEIFGVGFHGHFLAAKRVAQEVGSSFLVLELPFVKSSGAENTPGELEAVSKFQGLVACSVRLYITNDLQSQMIKLLSRYIDLSLSRLSPSTSVSKVASKEIQLESNYEAPQSAQSIYPYLLDLHDIFSDLPAMRKVLANAQKMLYNVNRGEAVDTNVISEVYALQIAVERLRISLTNAGHLPINKIREPSLNQAELSDLPVEDKSHALLVEALHGQTKKFETIVAVVDASGLAGLRKHWNTHVPLELEVKEMVGKLVTDCEGEGEMSNDIDRKRLLTDKPLVAVGAGATAVLGASSLSKAAALKFPASTLMKVVSNQQLY
ncbi:hypothetical protein D8674_000575 [Pyrus ussuriensis x Pyrus communis]|uniref:Uncharacterized protein n=1 Tax=Pyrus ussuriensis x Pyrus communis TaxID=2448454 RepID=A0A5N5F3W2_9ROSA|nr:hypothetical protein D8674_000575 [Pyrus ussuriensis x Pyrus communis]